MANTTMRRACSTNFPESFIPGSWNRIIFLYKQFLQKSLKTTVLVSEGLY